jgi:hypothetical protein
VLVRPDRRRVEEEPVEVGVLGRVEEAVPDAGPAPSVEPPPDGVPAPEFGWAVAPGPAVACEPVDGVEEAAVVVAGATARAGPSGEERGETVPVGVGDGVARPGGAGGARPVSPDRGRISIVHAS